MLNAQVMRSGAMALVASLVVLADGYRTSVGTGPDEVPVVVVQGTPYAMGESQGKLMREEVRGLLTAFLGRIQKAGGERFSNKTLDAAWDSVSPYVHKRFEAEMRGLAAGAGVPFETVRRAHMIPVVNDYSCSGVALWGTSTRDGHLYQIRNLDFSMDWQLQDYPALVVYAPTEGIPHVNVTFAGVIGVNTGMNAKGIALTEIGDTPGKEYPFNLDGAHFMTLFRDILYDAERLDGALRMVRDARRIKKYHYIIGDGKVPDARKLKAHAPHLEVWTDNDPKDELAPHVFEDAVCHAEGRTPIALAHLSRYRRKYDSSAMIQLSKSIGSVDGNLMNVVYDATGLELWVAYAEKRDCAYLRPYVHLKLGDYLPYDPKRTPLPNR